MKKILILLTTLTNLLWAQEKVDLNLFLGHDLYGQMKVDRTDIKSKFDNYSFNLKGTASYKLYNMIYVIGSIQVENYSIHSPEGKYLLIPMTLGIRYVDNKHGDFRPYISMSYGTNIVKGVDELPIDTKLNGFGEMDLGCFYKERYMIELSYKHHALAYKPIWPTLSSFWNGQFIGVNIGYKF